MEAPQNISSGLVVRTAREDDLERLVTIHSDAFPDARGREARRRNFVDNPRGTLDDLFVAEADGALLGHAFLFSMASWMGGREVAMSGMASVAVAPEARGQGVATALVRRLVAETRHRGQVACLLYPFRHAFYRRLGWGLVSEVRRLRLAPSSFPAYPDDARPRAARPEDLAALRRCYQRVASRGNGLLARSDRLWRTFLGTEGRHLFVVGAHGHEVSGYVMIACTAPNGGPAELDVVELVADDDHARRTLYGFLRAQRDQIATVRYLVAARDPLLAVLDEPRTPQGETVRTLVAVAGEWGAAHMARVVDVGGAVSARGYAADGQITLRVTEPLVPQGRVAGTLLVRSGTGSFGPERGGPILACDIGTFTQIWSGYLRPTDAVHLGVAAVDAPRTAALADALFALPSPHTLDYF